MCKGSATIDDSMANLCKSANTFLFGLEIVIRLWNGGETREIRPVVTICFVFVYLWRKLVVLVHVLNMLIYGKLLLNR